MATYARVEGDNVIELRELDDIPSHKASLWRQVSHEGDGPNETTIVESNVVRIVRSYDLPALKAKLKVQVASDAETCRQRFITPGSGKAMAYLEKHNQAEAVEDLGEAAANALSESDRKAQFPTLAASVGIEAPTLWECAQIVRQRYEAWADISYDIERKELAAKQAISLASDAAAVRAVYEAISWPTP